MATSEKISLEGIVIHLSKFKENDAMVKLATKEGFVSFLAHGVSKLTSKNGASCQECSYGRYSLSVSNDLHYTLSESTPIDSFINDSNLEALTATSFIIEVTNKLIQEDEAGQIYPYLFASLNAIKKGFSPLSAALIYFASCLNASGIGLDVNQCVGCGGKKNIIGLSFADGGFVCQDCYETMTGGKLSPRYLSIYRYIFKVPAELLTKVAFEAIEAKTIIVDLSTYLFDLTSLKLDSLKIIEKL